MSESHPDRRETSRSQAQARGRAACLRAVPLAGKQAAAAARPDSSAPAHVPQAALLNRAPRHSRKPAPGETIAFSVLAAPLDLGFTLLAATPRGLCAVLLGNNPEELRAELQHRFRSAVLHQDPALASLAEQIFATLARPAPALTPGSVPDLQLDLRPTAFQAQVWAALAQIPRGETRTYSQLAAQLGKPTAARAVARACAVNPIALVIPCHRAVGKSGALTGYRWGLDRKGKLLAAESRPTPTVSS